MMESSLWPKVISAVLFVYVNWQRWLQPVRGEIFEKILEWCEWHKDDPEESEDDSDDEDRDRRVDDIPQWDVKFIAKMSQIDTIEMMQACNYLDLQVCDRVDM